jgi:hypothetical protein
VGLTFRFTGAQADLLVRDHQVAQPGQSQAGNYLAFR